MGVYIKGMDMPLSCYRCWIPCEVPFEDRNHLSRAKNCPIVHVSPHGRLIDGDELAAKCDDPYWCVWLGDINDATTIIPAEREDE